MMEKKKGENEGGKAIGSNTEKMRSFSGGPAANNQTATSMGDGRKERILVLVPFGWRWILVFFFTF
jgi:hypothetical protein